MILDLRLEILNLRFKIWDDLTFESRDFRFLYDFRFENRDLKFDMWDYRFEILNDLRFDIRDLRFEIWA